MFVVDMPCIKVVALDGVLGEKVTKDLHFLHFLHFLHCPKLREGRPSFGRQCTFGKIFLHCFCTFCTFCPRRDHFRDERDVGSEPFLALATI